MTISPTLGWRTCSLACVSLLVLTLAACGEDDLASDEIATNDRTRSVGAAQLRRGAQLFAANCAECHGKHGEGAPDWETPDVDGRYPAPPLNGEGHTWHHSKTGLALVIRKGTERIGGGMSGWENKFSERDIEDVLAYVQSLWPQDVYEAWVKIDQRARAKQ